MGNSDYVSLSKINCLSLEEFKKRLPRKMNLHILSSKKEDGRELVRLLTGENFYSYSDNLFEENIKNKVQIYSFMNYFVYDDAKTLINKINVIISSAKDAPKEKSLNFKEVVLVLNNEKIDQQIKDIKKAIDSDDVYFPFLIFLSQSNLKLSGLNPKKTFHYRTTLDSFIRCLNQIKNNNIDEKDSNDFIQISGLLRRLNLLFSYYNELGDEFSFIPTNGKKENPVEIRIENDDEFPVFINVLLLGVSGSGKSTLINLILNEKKSIEGGTAFSTTSKDIIVYKTSNAPIRFYDVKGIEDESTIENYSKLLEKYNGKNNSSIDAINAIIYCVEYTNGTLFKKQEYKLFDLLVEHDIPILFAVTKMRFDPDIKIKNSKTKKSRREIIDRIKNAIKTLIEESLKKKKKSKR